MHHRFEDGMHAEAILTCALMGPIMTYIYNYIVLFRWHNSSRKLKVEKPFICSYPRIKMVASYRFCSPAFIPNIITSLQLGVYTIC